MQDTNSQHQLSKTLGAQWQVYAYQTCASTMDLAREVLPEIKPGNFGLVLSKTQSAGRGRQGRIWESASEEFYATYVFNSDKEAGHFIAFPLVCALVLQELLGDLGAKLLIKWPNDLLDSSNRKISGILIELVSNPNGSTLIVGIGFNLIECPTAAISLFKLSSVRLTALEFANLLSPKLAKAFETYSALGFADFHKNINSQLWNLGQELKIDTSGSLIIGKCLGLSPRGGLLIESTDGVQEILSGHVLV